MTHTPIDPARITLLVLIIAGMTIGSYVVVQPFLTPILWSTVVVIATWPLMLAVQRRLWNRRWLAMLVMTIALVVVFLLPLALAGLTLIGHLGDITRGIRALASSPPAPPEWLQRIPVFGPNLNESWKEVVIGGVQGLAQRLQPYMDEAVLWVGAMLGSFGLLLLRFALVVVVAAILFARGEVAAGAVLRFAHRLAGVRGEEVCALAARAIRGVALGVVVTALVQALLSWIGLAVCGVPLVALFTAIIFLSSVAQLGAGPLLLPIVIWLFWKGDTTSGVILLIFTIVVVNIDNVIRPLLIQRGAKLPLLLVFVGVVGGLLAFGVMGIFVGPVLLAVVYELLVEWVVEGEAQSASRSSAGDTDPQAPG